MRKEIEDEIIALKNAIDEREKANFERKYMKQKVRMNKVTYSNVYAYAPAVRS